MSYVADKLSISSLFLGPDGLIRASPLLKIFVVSVFEPVADAGRSGVCVCLTSSREGLPSRDTNRRAITPLNACYVIPPPDSAHQPLPGEMLADGCPLGNIWDSDFLESPFGIPPGASLCDT